MTPDYVYENIMPDDSDLATSLKSKALRKIRAKDVGTATLRRYRQMVQRMRIHPTPGFYIDHVSAGDAPQAEARMTRQNKQYIVINRAALTAWTHAQLLAVLGHELVHLKENHVSAVNIAMAHNDHTLSIAHELEADRIGSGPLGSCDPIALETALSVIIRIDKSHYLTSHATFTEKDYHAVTGIYHPIWPDREARLEAMRAQPQGRCVKISRRARPG